MSVGERSVRASANIQRAAQSLVVLQNNFLVAVSPVTGIYRKFRLPRTEAETSLVTRFVSEVGLILIVPRMGPALAATRATVLQTHGAADGADILTGAVNG